MSWSVVILLSAIVLAGNTDHFFPEKDKNEISLSYTGNMGVMIRSEKTALWIDGIHEYYGPAYLQTPEYLLKKAFEAKDEFRHLKFVLFSHYHKDHFSARLTQQLLQAKKDIRVIGSFQVTDSFEAVNILQARGRDGEIFSDKDIPLQIQSFDIPHTWAQRHAHVQNQAYLVELAGIRIAHIGDADTDEQALQKLFRHKIDVLIVPVWFLSGNRGKEILSRAAVKKVIATHIDPRSNAVQDNIPGIDIVYFSKVGDVLKLSCP